MKKFFLVSFFIFCSAAIIQANIVKNALDDGIYAAIHEVLRNQHPNEAEKNQCLVDDFRRNHVADKFYTIDLLTNHAKLQREIQPYVDEANIKCDLILFFQSPIGIFALIGLFLLAICFICCLIRCICC